MRRCRCNIGHVQQQVGCNLLLNPQAPLLNTRALEVRIDGKDGRLLDHSYSGPLKNLIHHREVGLADQLRGTRRVAGKVEPGIGIRRGIENAAASPNASTSAQAAAPQIAAPTDGTIFALDPDIPPARQRVWFERAPGSSARSAAPCARGRAPSLCRSRAGQTRWQGVHATPPMTRTKGTRRRAGSCPRGRRGWSRSTAFCP